MKRVWIAGTVIVAVVLIFIGNSSWNQKVEKTVKDAEERISEPASKELSLEKENSDDAKPDSDPTNDKSAENNGINQPKENAAADSVNTTVSAEENSKATASNSSTSSNSEAAKHTVEEIKAAYYPLFKELEAQETSKIDQLVVQAKADFLSSNAPASELLNKYEQIASGMEQNADRTFNALYQELQYDLEKNGHNKAEAEEFRQTYNSKKQARLQRIVDQMGSF